MIDREERKTKLSRSRTMASNSWFTCNGHGVSSSGFAGEVQVSPLGHFR